MILDPRELSHQEAYKLLNGAVIPRPIAFVSTVSASGEPNLAPFSFFNVVASDPMTVSVSIMRRGDTAEKKDTLLNIEETGEFVVNVVTEELVEAMNRTSADFPRGVDEFRAGPCTPVPSELVRPPRVLESPIHMECRLRQLVDLGDRPGSATLVLGEVVCFHVLDALYDHGRIRHDRFHAVGRLAGASYVRTRDTFELARPGAGTSLTGI